MIVRVQAGKMTSRVLGMRKLLTQLWEELGCEGLKGGDRGGGKSPGEAGQVEGAAQGCSGNSGQGGQAPVPSGGGLSWLWCGEK